MKRFKLYDEALAYCNQTTTISTAKSTKYYAVVVGRKPGVYTTLEECEKQVCYVLFCLILVIILLVFTPSPSFCSCLQITGYKKNDSRVFNTYKEALDYCFQWCTSDFVTPTISACNIVSKPSHTKTSLSIGGVSGGDGGGGGRITKHDKTDTELVQHYTSYHHRWNEVALLSEEKLKTLDEQRLEIKNRIIWAKYYAENSAKLAHYHLARSLGGSSTLPSSRPPSPLVPPLVESSTSDDDAIIISANSTVASSGDSNQGVKRSRGEDQQGNDYGVAFSDTSTKKIKALKADSILSYFILSITINFDGMSRGNPGQAGAGTEVLITDNSTAEKPIMTKYLIREYCGENVTNYFAEYKGLLAGLRQAKSIIEQLMPKLTSIEYTNRPPPLFQLRVYGVNNLMIQQLRGEWAWKHPNLLPLFEESQRLIIELKQCGNIWPSGNVSVVVFNHIYREHNQVAYDLADEAIDQCKSWITSSADELSEQDVVHVKHEIIHD